MKKGFILRTLLPALLVMGVLLSMGCPSDGGPGVSGDTTAPVLSGGSVSGLTSETGASAALTFTSDEAGVYYYLVLGAGETAPVASTIQGQVSAAAKGTGNVTTGQNTINVTGLNGGQNYTAYIIAADAAGNISNVLVITGVNPVAGTQSAALNGGVTAAYEGGAVKVTINQGMNSIAAGDVFKVYGNATLTTQIGTDTATGSSGDLVITTSNITDATVTVYVTITRSGKTESTGYSATYTKPGTNQSAALSGGVTAAYEGGAVKVTINQSANSIAAGDVFKVYGNATLTTQIGTEAATGSSGNLVITTSNTTDATVTVYVTITRSEKRKSQV
jgi:uncharacterized protein YaiE (UPF0345 family)